MKSKQKKERKKKMITFKSGFKYTIVYTMNVREVSNEYPNGKIILLEDDGDFKLIAVEERR